jgi:hypothetical protein
MDYTIKQTPKKEFVLIFKKVFGEFSIKFEHYLFKHFLLQDITLSAIN